MLDGKGNVHVTPAGASGLSTSVLSADSNRPQIAGIRV